MTIHTVPDHTPDQRAATRAEPRMPRAPARAAPRSDIREAVVARAKRLLAQGYYDNTHVLVFAVARLLEEAMSDQATTTPARSDTPGRRDAETESPAHAPPRGGRR